MWVYVVFAVVFGLLLFGLTRMAESSRRSGKSSSFGVLDEMYHPMAYESHLEIKAEEERQVPRETPGDPPFESMATRWAAYRASRPTRARTRRRRFLRRFRR